jgi:hypothetical protein
VAAAYTSLRTVTPPDAEPLDIAVVRRHCRIDQTYDDDLLGMQLTVARQWAEQYLNRALMTQTLLYSWSSTPPPTATPLVPQSLIIFPLNFPPLVRRAIELPRAPVTKVNTVKWGPIDDMQTADPDDYRLNLAVEPAQILIRPQLIPILPQQNLQIEYVAGYGDDPKLIPAGILQAILILTAHLYEHRGDANAEMPDAATLIMGMHRLWTFSG